MRSAYLIVFVVSSLFAVELSGIAQTDKEPRFMASPGPYQVGFATTSLYDDSRPSTAKSDLSSQPIGRRIQLVEWYPADKGGKEMGIPDYLRLAATSSQTDSLRGELPVDLLKGFESSKSDMLAKMNAVPKRERFPLVKGGVKAGQCGGVKVGHFWHKKVLGVTGSVASGA